MRDYYILVAEDDPDDRFLLNAAFEENGFTERIEYVGDGVELVAFLEAIPDDETAEDCYPRFILLDLNMPRKDGREVLFELKRHPRWSEIPVIVFSTTYNEIEIRRCYELGASSYIAKPNSFEELKKIVTTLRGDWMYSDGFQ